MSLTVENPSQDYFFQWADHQTNLIQTFEATLNSTALTDAILVCEGSKVLCHRIILAASSNFFYRLFTENPLSSRAVVNPPILIRGIQLRELMAILHYMYRGKVQVANENINLFLQAAQNLEVTSIVNGRRESNGNLGNSLTSKPSTSVLLPMLSLIKRQRPQVQNYFITVRPVDCSLNSTAAQEAVHQHQLVLNDDLQVSSPLQTEEIPDVFQNSKSDAENPIQSDLRSLLQTSAAGDIDSTTASNEMINNVSSTPQLIPDLEQNFNDQSLQPDEVTEARFPGSIVQPEDIISVPKEEVKSPLRRKKRKSTKNPGFAWQRSLSLEGHNDGLPKKPKIKVKTNDTPPDFKDLSHQHQHPIKLDAAKLDHDYILNSSSQASVTSCGRKYRKNPRTIPVVEQEGALPTGKSEKPTSDYLINRMIAANALLSLGEVRIDLETAELD